MTGCRKNKDCDWAFDLRAFNYDYSSDDSDGDGQTPGSNKKQHEVRLEEFDLGSREESVSYKPNPFSIAKINAAYRSSRNEGSAAKGSLPQKGPPGKARGLVQTKIDDVLKTQKSNSLKKTVSKKNPRPPGASYSYSKPHPKLPRPKVGPGTDRAFVQPQNVENSNANPNLEESYTVRSSFSVSLEPTLLSENAHTSTLAPSVDARLNDDPACVIDILSPFDNEDVKLDSVSPFLEISSVVSPPRSAKLEPIPKHESSPLTLPTSQHNLRFVELRPALSNSGQVDQKCSADRQVKQELSLSSEVSGFGRTETRTEDAHLSQDRARTPFIPRPGNRNEKPNPPPAIKTDPVRTHAPLPKVRIPERRTTMAQSVTTPVVPLKRSIGDAYSFSVEDTDENWCTLPTRKKQMPKNHPNSSFSVTKSFRLPGLLPPRNTVQMETGKRVMTYLPPPPMHPSAGDSRLSYQILQVQDEKRSLVTPAAYPSPGHSCISRLSQASKARRASVSQPVLAPTIRERNLEIYRPPSPPTSDPPLTSSNGADVRIQVDLRVIRDNYPRRKGTSHKVFPFYFFSTRFGDLCLRSYVVTSRPLSELKVGFGSSKRQHR